MKRFLTYFGLTVFLTGNIFATQFDIGVSELDMKKSYLSDVEYIVVSGRVKNYGSQTINSYKIHYQINNGEVFDLNVSGTMLIQNAERAFMHPEPVEPIIGRHTIKVWTSLPNGQEDENPANDAITFVFDVYDADTYIPRTILVESFTSSSCAPCVGGNENLKARLMENTGSYALIKYQMNWPGNGDPYFTAEATVRRNYYGVNSVPWAQIEGSKWGGSTYNVTQTFLTDFQAEEASMHLNVDFYVEGQTLYSITKIVSPVDITNTNLRLYLAIVEKTTYLNETTNGEKEFAQVMKKFMPDANAIVLRDIKANTPHIILQQWEFKGNYRLPLNALSPINHNIEHSVENFGNLSIVAWVQHNQDRSVKQATNGVSKDNFTVEFTCVNGELGTISASIDENPVFSGDYVNVGDKIVFTANPKEGYQVKEWRLNGALFQAGNANSIEITANNFTVVSVEFQEMTNIEKQTVSGIVIYPNPVENQLGIGNYELGIVNVAIFDVYGRNVVGAYGIRPSAASTIVIDVSHLASGVYFVEIETVKGEKVVKKMIKK